MQQPFAQHGRAGGSRPPTSMTIYRCELCEMFLNGRQQWQDHLRSRRHRGRLAARWRVLRRWLTMLYDRADARSTAAAAQGLPLPPPALVLVTAFLEHPHEWAAAFFGERDP